MATPKVFSLFKTSNYGRFFPKIKILSRPYNIFLQCYSYDIILPITGQQEHVLNIFEETVLKLLNYKSCSVNEIAEALCMNKDLINFIIIRLKELGLLDNKYNVSDKGKQLLNIYKQNEKEMKYLPGKIFVNKETNEILPYVHTGEFVCEDVIEYTGGNIKIALGNAGSNRTCFGKYLRKKIYNATNKPTQSEIRKLLRSYNKICLSGQRFSRINIDNEYAIDISRSEDVTLHLQAVIQEGNVDSIIISDGFVLNVDSLSDYITKEYPEIIYTFKKNATEQWIENQQKANVSTSRDKYPELQWLLRERETDAKNQDEKNQDEKREAFGKNKVRLTDCFAALEWSLHYYLLANPVSEKILAIFKNQTSNENKYTIANFSKRIGGRDIDNNIKIISNLDKGKINYYFQSNQPALYTVLPLAIAEAAQNSESSIHNLVRVMPDFLSFVCELNGKSQRLRHAAEAGNENDEFDEIYQKTRKFVETIIPDLVFTEKNDTFTRKVSASQQRINAEVSLSEEFGSVFFSTLDKNIQNELMKISLDKHVDKCPLPYEYILVLSRILESYLFQTLKNIKSNKTTEKEAALEKIEKRFELKLPKSFTAVRSQYYKSALLGEKATLGAYSIVLLAFIDDALIESLNKKRFIDTINEICDLRKHGNNVGLCIDFNKLIILRNKVIQVIKTIGGYYG